MKMLLKPEYFLGFFYFDNNDSPQRTPLEKKIKNALKFWTFFRPLKISPEKFTSLEICQKW